MSQAKILVVDDEKEICELTAKILGRKNYSVFTAYSQDEALAQIKKESPHIALLDMKLGQFSGIDVLEKIKATGWQGKAVMVTGLYDEKLVKEAKLKGADDYILKPFTAVFLYNLIEEKLKGLI